jgi:hypothetical protein
MGLMPGLAPLDDSGNMVQSFGSSMNNNSPSAPPQSNFATSDMDAPF